METVYRAFDGKIFETEKECKEYEIKNNYLPPMWNLKGNSTTDLSGDAYFVYFDSIEQIENFIHLCDTVGITADGLINHPDGTRDTDVEPGFYYFNTYHSEWLKIPDAFVNKDLR